MSDLIQLSDAEIAAVAGGVATVTAHQTNSSSVSQSASATNSGAVSASNGAGSNNFAAAAGAEASNTAVVTQVNVARASNRFSFRL
jgi:hypothetical protein